MIKIMSISIWWIINKFCQKLVNFLISSLLTKFSQLLKIKAVSHQVINIMTDIAIKLDSSMLKMILRSESESWSTSAVITTLVRKMRMRMRSVMKLITKLIMRAVTVMMSVEFMITAELTITAEELMIMIRKLTVSAFEFVSNINDS